MLVRLRRLCIGADNCPSVWSLANLCLLWYAKVAQLLICKGSPAVPALSPNPWQLPTYALKRQPVLWHTCCVPQLSKPPIAHKLITARQLAQFPNAVVISCLSKSRQNFGEFIWKSWKKVVCVAVKSRSSLRTLQQHRQHDSVKDQRIPSNVKLLQDHTCANMICPATPA